MILEFEVFGVVQVQRELIRFGERVGDVSPAFHEVQDMLQGDIAEQFDSQGGSMSGGWAPLKPETIAAKAALGQDLRILHATHRLRESLTDDAGSDAIREVHADEMRFGSEVDYGGFHMSGTSKMVARPPVDTTDAQRVKYVKEIQRYIVTGMTSGGIA